jgi:hypothetical protein
MAWREWASSARKRSQRAEVDKVKGKCINRTSRSLCLGTIGRVASNALDSFARPVRR